MLTEIFKERAAFAIEGIDTSKVMAMARSMIDKNGTVYLIGNGGSAANAEHAANDLMKIAGLSSVALTQTAVLTAYANDVDYESCFSEPISEMMTKYDTLIAISVSGRSPNILKAMRTAIHCGAIVVGLFGESTINNDEGFSMPHMRISVNDDDFGVVETVHQAILHMIANKVKEIKDVDHGS